MKMKSDLKRIFDKEIPIEEKVMWLHIAEGFESIQEVQARLETPYWRENL